jgi:hypothetical protein
MTTETRKRLAKEYGARLLAARAKRRHSVQKLHDLIEAKGHEPPFVRTIQRNEKGDRYPWKATRTLYAEIYPELAD